MSSLAGKVALVTGASKGIGAGIALELAARGAAVAVNYAGGKAGAEALVAEIKAKGGKAIAVQATVTDAASVEQLVAVTAKELGPIDILVNNAGVYEFLPIDAVTPEHYHKQFDVNVLGLLLVTKAALGQFAATGGSIVNIGSVAAGGVPYGSVYSATKGAVDTITKALAQELGGRKIRVNSLNPGLVKTEGTQTAGILGSDFEAQAVKDTPLGRAGEPRDIATVAAFLASDDAYWVNGQTIEAAGGARL